MVIGQNLEHGLNAVSRPFGTPTWLLN